MYILEITKNRQILDHMNIEYDLVFMDAIQFLKDTAQQKSEPLSNCDLHIRRPGQYPFVTIYGRQVQEVENV